MQLLSINVGRPRAIQHGGKTAFTGIFKQPVDRPVVLQTCNLVGDEQADVENHGGLYKAVYAYASENYDYWKDRLGRDDLLPGQFGENFTVEGMTDDVIHVGDLFVVGEAMVEVTQPRVPCFKLGHRMGDPQFVGQFHESCRTGFYLRVLHEGVVTAGDRVERIKVDPRRMTVERMYRAMYFEDDAATLAKALQIEALSPQWREMLAEKQRKLATAS